MDTPVGLHADADAAPPGQQAARDVHARLRRDIITGVLSAGQMISQVQLAAELGVSRTPLREALKLLEREGLVEAEHNKRVRIAGFRVEELEEIYAMRIAIEVLAIRTSIPRLTDQDVESLGENAQSMRDYAARKDYEAWETPHRRFHQTLVRYSGATICRTLDQLSDHAERYRYATSTQGADGWPQGTVEHNAILEAVGQGSPTQAANALARHYARVALNAVAIFAPEHDPRVLREALRATLQQEPPPGLK
jgi:DNA-binding GntR family transcriptional regulator